MNIETTFDQEKANKTFRRYGVACIEADHITLEVRQNFFTVRKKDGKWLIFKDEESYNLYRNAK